MKKITLFTFLLFIISCNNENTSKEVEIIDYTIQNEEEIVAYIADNNLTAERSDSGLYYVINNEGEGENPTATSTVRVAYTGYYLNGNVFDKSDDEGIEFGLNQVIKGWTEGIQLFKAGGNGKLLIPSHLGYGSTDYRGIPGGSVLIFDIALHEIK